MSRGHVTGRKREHAEAQEWYRAIEQETLEQLEAQERADAEQEVSD